MVGSIIFIAIVCAADKLTKAGNSTLHIKNEKIIIYGFIHMRQEVSLRKMESKKQSTNSFRDLDP